MSARTFRLQVILTILLVLSACAIAIIVGWNDPLRLKHTTQIPGIIIPVGGAWLAFCFQRRVAFTKALSDVWLRMVGTVQDAFQYTHLSNPDRDDYAKIMRELSCRIDDVRGVFRNIGERSTPQSDHNKNFVLLVKTFWTIDLMAAAAKLLATTPRHTGLYPFESLKQIQRVISILGYGDRFSPEKARQSRLIIDGLWKVLRAELLKELDRDYPEYADTPFGRA